MQSPDCRPSPASVVSPSPLVESPCPSLATHHACLLLLIIAGGDEMPSVCVCVGGEGVKIRPSHTYMYTSSSSPPVQF